MMYEGLDMGRRLCLPRLRARSTRGELSDANAVAIWDFRFSGAGEKRFRACEPASRRRLTWLVRLV